MLRIEELRKSFPGPDGPVHVLTGVSLEVQAGEFVTVRGGSGSGKSTLLLSAGGLLAPDSGRVRIDATDLYAISSEQRACLRARHVGFVFQQFHLIPYLSAMQNVLAAAVAWPIPDAQARAERLLRQFQMWHRRDHVPAKLSTGERQRIALSRAMMHEPRLLLADEPTGNLDPDNAHVVLEALRRFAADGGAVMLVTHALEAASYADQTLLLRDGLLQRTETEARMTAADGGMSEITKHE